MTDALSTIALDTPIVRGDQAIATVQLRKPSSGELRGISLARLGQMEVDQLMILLPRITMPNLTAPEVAALDVADLMELADKVMDFLLSKARKADLPTA